MYRVTVKQIFLCILRSKGCKEFVHSLRNQDIYISQYTSTYPYVFSNIWYMNCEYLKPCWSLQQHKTLNNETKKVTDKQPCMLRFDRSWSYIYHLTLSSSSCCLLFSSTAALRSSSFCLCSSSRLQRSSTVRSYCSRALRSFSLISCSLAAERDKTNYCYRLRRKKSKT